MGRLVILIVLIAGTTFAQESPHGDIKIECSACHGTESWAMMKNARFKHESTGFELTGQHKTLKCEFCHKSLRFDHMDSNCASCHTDVHRSELGTNCSPCHTTRTWQIPDMVQKHQQTRFPLLGRHSTVDCQSCHSNAANYHYVGTPSTCIGCHRADFQAAKAPDHVTAGFSTDCVECHNVTAFAWSSGFDHNQTRFPLTGAHRPQPCSSCHGDNVFAGKPIECVACHQSAFEAVLEPNHVTNGFPQECEVCHTTIVWSPSSFDHNNTMFPLTGAHQAVACSGCHASNQYQGLTTVCYDCHTTDFVSVTNPNHVAGNFSHDCTQCHSTSGWIPASFDHNATAFPLTGSHTVLLCQSCHVNGDFQLVYSDCYQCHQADYQIPTSPNHVAGNFSHNCQSCHATTSWTPSTFDHNNTMFPLTGAHQAVACSGCHASNQYQGLTTVCYDCHTTDFVSVTNPNHVAGNFSHDCIQCHTTSGWFPASFDHNTTAFPLTGSHTALLCQSCHVNGDYQLVYNDCYQCHQPDYQIPTDPNHVVLNFSHNCATCHTTTAWLPSVFDHDGQYFRIYSGKHRGKWSSCADCHANPSNFADFTCLSCHEHRQSAMDDKHRNVPGYLYSSPACYDCHQGV
jgi:mRNA-degrading endonuclease YafQ of YafQ-DinJ toxin-antitoxin module